MTIQVRVESPKQLSIYLLFGALETPAYIQL